MLRILFILLAAVNLFAQDDFPQTYKLWDFRGGLIDKWSSLKLPDNASPDCANVIIDDDNAIQKRTGYVKFNSVSLGSYYISNLYVYNKVNGSSYLIANTSSCIYAALTDGTFSLIKSGLNPNYDCRFVTANDLLYETNGSTNPVFKWSGNDTVDLPDLPKCKYIAWYKNKLFLANASGLQSNLYYSTTLNPEDFSGEGSGVLFVSNNDGDVITGLMPYQDILIIWKRYSTWALYGNSKNNFELECIDSRVGCLYDIAATQYKGNVIWISHRGIELFNGQNITKLSTPIDNTMNLLRQLKPNKISFTRTNNSDFVGKYYGTQLKDDAINNSVCNASLVLPIPVVSSTILEKISVSTNGTIVQISSDSNNVVTGKVISLSYLNPYVVFLTTAGNLYLQKFNDGLASNNFTVSLVTNTVRICVSNTIMEFGLSPNNFAVDNSSGVHLCFTKGHNIIPADPMTVQYNTHYEFWYGSYSVLSNQWAFSKVDEWNFNSLTNYGAYIGDPFLGKYYSISIDSNNSVHVVFSGPQKIEGLTPTIENYTSILYSSYTQQSQYWSKPSVVVSSYPTAHIIGKMGITSDGNNNLYVAWAESSGDLVTGYVYFSSKTYITQNWSGRVTIQSGDTNGNLRSGSNVAIATDLKNNPYIVFTDTYNIILATMSGYSIYLSTIATGKISDATSSYLNLCMTYSTGTFYLSYQNGSTLNHELLYYDNGNITISTIVTSSDYNPSALHIARDSFYTTDIKNSPGNIKWGLFESNDNGAAYVFDNVRNTTEYKISAAATSADQFTVPFSTGAGTYVYNGNIITVPYASNLTYFQNKVMFKSNEYYKNKNQLCGNSILKVYDFSVWWYLDLFQNPFSVFHNDNYYLAVSSGNSFGNDTILNYNDNGVWNRWYLPASALTEYNTKIQAGDTLSGQVYTLDLSTNADNASSINSYYVTKDFNFGLPENDKVFIDYRVTAKKNAAPSSVTVGYAINMSTTYTNSTIDLSTNTNAGIINQKVVFPSGSRGKYINFKVSQNSTDTFKIYGIDINYIPENMK